MKPDKMLEERKKVDTGELTYNYMSREPSFMCLGRSSHIRDFSLKSHLKNS